jgi:type I restriction-modification system DNA methylase subunit
MKAGNTKQPNSQTAKQPNSQTAKQPIFWTEDEVRDLARDKLNLFDNPNAKCGVGQITTFNQLGFKGVMDKPDGWYFPNKLNEVAIILETKNSGIDISDAKCLHELKKNISIASIKYKRVIGILYNGVDVLILKDGDIVDLKNHLFPKEYYLKLYDKNSIDKNLIFSLTERINNNLHKNFGVNNLYHRMIFTSCALVAQRYNQHCLIRGMDWATLHTSILSTIKKSYELAKKQNQKLDLIAEQFTLIQCNYTENQEAINEFIECINNISSSINSDYWNGEDVMAIFFNEFTRYKGKSEQGQVFTPDHITSFIYRITGTTFKDNVLDACCGSGAFLVKAMSYMISEVGGINNDSAVKVIKDERLFGIEFSKELYALACANMLIHKDGKTNLIQDDSRTEEVGKWIKSKNITRVLMNPPYESAYGCLTIIENVLTNVCDGAICAFVLPDNKLEVSRGWIKKILNKHSLLKIIKLPDVFAGMASVETSVFIFKAHEPQNGKDVFGCWIKDDGLETVKNKGRLDVKNKWQNIENKWVEIIYKQSGHDTIQWMKPETQLMYKLPEQEVEMYQAHFKKTVLRYKLFENTMPNSFVEQEYSKIIVKEMNDAIITNSIAVLNFLNENKDVKLDTSTWTEFKLSDMFKITGSKTTKKQELEKSGEGQFPYVTTKGTENGISGYFNIQTEDGNCLTIDSAVLGSCFYQARNFSASDHVEVLRPLNSNFNKCIGLFMKAVLDASNINKYNYGFKYNQTRIANTVILLPSICINGVVTPDWKFMDNYISDLFKSMKSKMGASI